MGKHINDKRDLFKRLQISLDLAISEMRRELNFKAIGMATALHNPIELHPKALLEYLAEHDESSEGKWPYPIDFKYEESEWISKCFDLLDWMEEYVLPERKEDYELKFIRGFSPLKDYSRKDSDSYYLAIVKLAESALGKPINIDVDPIRTGSIWAYFDVETPDYEVIKYINKLREAIENEL